MEDGTLHFDLHKRTFIHKPACLLKHRYEVKGHGHGNWAGQVGESLLHQHLQVVVNSSPTQLV